MPSTILPLGERSGGVLPVGGQRPRILHAPEFVSSTGQEAIELAELAGLELDEWQKFVLVCSLGETAFGRWVATTVGLTVARQNGKGSVLEARELAGLFLLGEDINHTAHQQKTATNHFKRVLRLVEGVPEFDRRVLKAPTGKGNEAIQLRGGQEIFFATRKGGGGRGLTFKLQVYDEAMYLSEQDRASLAPTMAAQSMAGGIQTWYVGSAVDEEDPAQDGVPFAQVRESGLARKPGVAYFEWSAPGDDPADVSEEFAADPAMWALANPGLGIRISHEWVEHERSVEMGARSFAVERLGIGKWPDPNAAAQDKIAVAAWDALTDVDSKRSGAVSFAFDVNPERTRAAIAVGGHREDGLEHVEITDHHAGTGWLVDRLVELKERHWPEAILCDARGPAASFISELENRGVIVEAVDAQEHARSCGGLVDAVKGQSFRHLGTGELRDALKGAKARSLGDSWAWARKSSSVDISPLVAVTLALRKAELMRESVYEDRGLAVL